MKTEEQTINTKLRCLWEVNRRGELNRSGWRRSKTEWWVMGAAGSKLEKALGDQFPEGERYFGLENFGNTCYCNSVLQVLRPPIFIHIFFLLLNFLILEFFFVFFLNRDLEFDARLWLFVSFSFNFWVLIFFFFFWFDQQAVVSGRLLVSLCSPDCKVVWTRFC